MSNATLPGLARFFALNMSLVGTSVWFVLTKAGTDGSNRPLLLPLLATVAVIVALQYPILLVAPNWWLKSLVFYGSMLVFLFLVGFLTCMRVAGWTWESAAKAVPLTLLFVWAGHALGVFAFPIILAANWLARKWLFHVS